MIKKYLILLIIITGTNLFADAPDTLWTRTFGGTGMDYGISVEQTKDGGFIATGVTWSFGIGGDVYLVKTNSFGDTLWTRTYGGTGKDDAYSVQQTSDSGFIIAGRTYSFGVTLYDVYLIRTNSSGDTLWTRTFGGIGHDYGWSARQTSDGGFIVTGFTNSFGAGNWDVYLIKTDSLGNTMWARTYGGTDNDAGKSVQETQDGGFIVAGQTWSFGAGNSDFYLIRTNSSGDTIWTRTYGGTYYEEGVSVQQTSDSGFVITGYTTSFGAGADDIYLVRTNSSGDTMWTKTFGGTSSDYGNSVRQTEDGGFIVIGLTFSFGAGPANFSDVYLIRLAKEGAGVEEEQQQQQQSSVVGGQLSVIKDKIYLSVPNRIEANIKIYDLCGRLKSTVYQGILNKGNYTFAPNIRNNGIYFATLSTDVYKETKKLILIK
ncbi:MAG: T9SS type A sorting domain-containing protein [bacterium]|nr:T9SS type A sorting domain-containing protein [bacterium]